MTEPEEIRVVPVLEFLRELFPLREGPTEYVRVLTASEVKWPESYYWFAVSELHTMDEFQLGDVDREVYFTPHVYTSRNSGEKTNAAGLIDVVWMDCDDEFFKPQTISEAAPSIIVETSPRRYHVYWLLKSPATKEHVERTNKALAYKYLQRDRSGWDLSQLLRVPGYTSYKRPILHTIRIVDWHPERRYDIGVFRNLPEIPILTVEVPYPAEDELKSLADIEHAYERLFTLKLRDAMTKKATDRSTELWYLYNEGFRIGMSREEVFVLAGHSVNNKFADNAYNADAELWKDLCGAWAMQHHPERVHILQQLDDIKKTKGLRPDDRKQKLAQAIFGHMTQTWRPYYSESTNEPFFYINDRIISVDPYSTRLKEYLDLHYDVNPATEEYMFIAWHIRNRTVDRGLKVELKTLSYWDEDHKMLYVTDFAGGIWRLDGWDITHVENGVDGGVFFREEPSAIPYSPVWSAQGTIEQHILKRANFDPERLDPEIARFLCRAWIYALFFPEMMETRPLLVVEGDRGSGKSTLFRSIETALRGPIGTVTELPTDQKSFKETVREQNYVFFDGVDHLWPGLANLLSTVSTGAQERVRILYTNNEFATYRLRAFFGISTMDAKFLREDVADRSILLTVSRLKKMIPESDLKRLVLEFRNEIWGELLTDLNRLVNVLQDFEIDSVGLRMADFAKLLAALCEVHEVDVEDMLRVLRKEQAKAVLQRDPVFDAIVFWLRNPDNVGREIATGDLHRELQNHSLMHGLGYERVCVSAKSLGHRIKQSMSNLQEVMDVEQMSRGGTNIYRFNLIGEEAEQPLPDEQIGTDPHAEGWRE